ncbi:hypothetical protein GGS21DRAFT_439600 [Xylaria nigripes]|nr:hypothetical protein GGS21DRAFT_439600 [Xylaria nigripes]
MSFTGNIFSKLGFGEGQGVSLLPQYVSPPSRPFNEHDLAELSPRPDDALLASPVSDHAQNRGSPGGIHNKGDYIYAQKNRNRAKMKTSVTFQEPPRSPGGLENALHDDRAGKRVYKNNEPNPNPPGIWWPSLPPESRGSHAGKTNGQLPFFESIFISRPAYSQNTSIQVDQTFKFLERRQNQMQQELQQLLDAQDYALEKHLASTAPDDDAPQHVRTLVSDTPNGHVVPVRQPKKRHLSKREARLGIARCMSQLSDLKNEEEAYIATALAERKAAISRLRNWSTKRASILAEMQAIESDKDQPLKNQIEKMERQYGTVCEDIVKLEEKLRDLRRTKTKLETKIAEAKSTRDSELSGYKGALSECDKCINDFMTYPEVSVLEVEGLMAQRADLQALAGQHISGFELISLRPERRTLPMIKDWWEGEVRVLELCKVAVDKERAALDEGTRLWQDMLGRLEQHDQHLKLTFNAISQYTSEKHSTPQFDREAGDVLKKQYALCKDTAHELEELHKYAETQGWKLLVTALGAEMHYFQGLKQQLGDTLQVVGWAEGVVTPRPGTPSHVEPRSGGDDLIGEGLNAKAERDKDDVEDELAGSIIRHWSVTDDLLGAAAEHRKVEDNDHDNEVHPGLLHRSQHGNETEDEHNEVPPEFLSMHSPPLKSIGKGKGKMIAREKEEELMQTNRSDEGDEDETQFTLSRKSSANDVPPDLLTESHHTLD